MINTKPNTNFNSVFFILIFLGLYSCNTNETFTFDKQNFTTDNSSDCKNIDCAAIEVNLLKIIDDRPVCKRINKEIESVACAVLNIGDDTEEETLHEAIHKFNNSYKDINEEFPDETVPYEANIDCKLSFDCKTLISVAMDSYIFTGGAHGYSSVSFINIDAKSGKRLLNHALFKNYAAFEHYAEKIFRKENNIAENQGINSTGFFFENDTFTLPENIGFTDNEVILYYNQYEINSYAAGPIELKLNKKDVASFFVIEIF